MGAKFIILDPKINKNIHWWGRWRAKISLTNASKVITEPFQVVDFNNDGIEDWSMQTSDIHWFLFSESPTKKSLLSLSISSNALGCTTELFREAKKEIKVRKRETKRDLGRLQSWGCHLHCWYLDSFLPNFWQVYSSTIIVHSSSLYKGYDSLSKTHFPENKLQPWNVFLSLLSSSTTRLLVLSPSS